MNRALQEVQFFRRYHLIDKLPHANMESVYLWIGVTASQNACPTGVAFIEERYESQLVWTKDDRQATVTIRNDGSWFFNGVRGPIHYVKKPEATDSKVIYQYVKLLQDNWVTTRLTP